MMTSHRHGDQLRHILGSSDFTDMLVIRRLVHNPLRSGGGMIYTHITPSHPLLKLLREFPYIVKQSGQISQFPSAKGIRIFFAQLANRLKMIL